MKKLKNIVVPEILTLSPIAIGLCLWNRLPETMATHFDMNGMPNGFCSRAFAVFVLPAFLALLLLVANYAVERKECPGAAKNLCPWLIAAVSLLMYVWIYGYALYSTSFKSNVLVSVLFALMGLLFAVIGNYLPKIRKNFFVGIRVPWTLASEENWYKTHRFAAPIWVVGGVIIAVGGGLRLLPMPVLFGMIMVMALVPILYSFLLSRKEKKEE